MDSSTKKLLSGSMVYFVGNALTQLISLLLMRFVTGNITPEEYGYFNLVTTVSNLVIPFVTLQIADAVFKFVLKAEDDRQRKTYFTICFAVCLASVALIMIIPFGISALIVPVPHTTLVALYVASSAMFAVYQKIVRCLNKNKVFVEANLIKTLIFILLEILLISKLDLGVEALLIANIVSTVFVLIYAECRVHALAYVDIRLARWDTFGEMMRFSVPLIPNAVFWWLTSSVNNVIVSARLGMDVNGIYTVSNKFSGVLNMVISVINMSWQDTAVADYGRAHFDTFLTKTFNTFVKLVFSATAVMIPFVAVVLPYMVDPQYYGAIPYAPFLLLCSSISALSGFLAQIYTGKGETKTLLDTSMVAMVVNVSVILLLIGKTGLWAAVVGTLASNVALVLSRGFFARKEFARGIHWGGFALIGLMLIVGFLLYFLAQPLWNLIWLFVSVAVALVVNRHFVKDVFTVLLRKN